MRYKSQSTYCSLLQTRRIGTVYYLLYIWLFLQVGPLPTRKRCTGIHFRLAILEQMRHWAGYYKAKS